MKGILSSSEESVRRQISETLIGLCKRAFSYSDEVSVEALVGIKVDKKEVYLFNVQKTSRRDGRSDDTDEEEEDDVS